MELGVEQMEMGNRGHNHDCITFSSFHISSIFVSNLNLEIMTPQRELDVKIHFSNNSELTVTLVNEHGYDMEKTFANADTAIYDINSLECEYDVYF